MPGLGVRREFRLAPRFKCHSGFWCCAAANQAHARAAAVTRQRNPGRDHVSRCYGAGQAGFGAEGLLSRADGVEIARFSAQRRDSFGPFGGDTEKLVEGLIRETGLRAAQMIHTGQYERDADLEALPGKAKAKAERQRQEDPSKLSFDECFKRCTELTARTREECFDTCAKR